MRLPSKFLPAYRLSAMPGRRTSQRGSALVEAIAAIAVTATAGAAALGLVSVSSAGSAKTSAEATGSWLAASQAEKIHAAQFIPTPGQYQGVAEPAGFTVTNTTGPIAGGDSAIQLVTITVSKGAGEIVRVDLVKVNR